MSQTIVPVLGEATVQELREAVRGEIVTPGDDAYAEARRIWNGAHDGRRPALVVRCKGPADVIGAVGFARSNDLTIAVRGGGHSVAGFSTSDGGIVIDLSQLNGVRVDPAGRRATVGGGAVWADVDHETQAHGLATTGGLVSSTGVAGFTLGGGIGWTMRKFGLACDNLVGADEVVARETELAHRPADAAAEREAGDAGRRHEAAGRGEPVRLRLVVDVGPDRAAADGRPASGGIHPNAVQLREIDHDPAVRGREAGDAVAAAAHRDRQVVAAREPYRADHVGRALAADDERRPAAVVRTVPDPPRLRVTIVFRRHDLSLHGRTAFLNCCFPENRDDRLAHLRLPFVLGVQVVLSGAALPGLRGSLATPRSRSSTSATPSASSRAA